MFKKNSLIFLLIYLVIILLNNKIILSCDFFSNLFNYECISNRDYSTTNINIFNISIEKNTSIANGFDGILFLKESGKNQLYIYKKDPYSGSKSYSLNDYYLNVYKYDIASKKFVYLGYFLNLHITDLNKDNSNEFLYINPVQNKIKILDLSSKTSGIELILGENETLLTARGDKIIVMKDINNSHYNLTIYEGASLNKINISLEKDSVEPFIFINNNNYDIYYRYFDRWYLVKNKLNNWENKIGYLREEYNTYVINTISSKYLSIVDLSFNKILPFNYYEDPIFSIGYFKNKEYLFTLDLVNEILDIYLINKSDNSIIKTKTLENISFFVYNNEVFLVIKNKRLYYTLDLINFNQLFNYEVDKVYLFDYDNDNKDELIIFSSNNIYLYNDKNLKDVDYFIKNFYYDKPLKTYSKEFKIEVCSVGSQILPFNLSIEINNDGINLPFQKNWERIILDSGKCRNFSINYIPLKIGNLSIKAKIEVEDKELNNNEKVETIKVVHDFWAINSSFSTINDYQLNKGIIFIDENDDLKDGYEVIMIKNNSDFNCSYILTDYNNNGIKEYLLDCKKGNKELLFKLADPMKKEVYNSILFKKDILNISFYIGKINETHYFFISPYKNNEGRIIEKKYSTNKGGHILEIDYNLDGIKDFVVYSSIVDNPINNRISNEIDIIGKDLDLKSYSINNYLNNSFEIIQKINLDIYYVGLFNESGEISLKVLGDDYKIKINNSFDDLNILKKQTPYQTYNKIIGSNFEINKRVINSNLLKISNIGEFKDDNNELSVDFCDLSLEYNESEKKILINKNGNCSNGINLIILNSKKDIIFENDSYKKSYFKINKSIIDEELTFLVYNYKILDNNLNNNKLKLNFDLNDLIDINVEEKDLVLYKNSTIKIKIRCEKDFKLNVSLKCGEFNKKEKLNCVANKDIYLDYEIKSKKKFSCIFNVQNSKGIFKQLRFDPDFYIPKVERKFFLKDKDGKNFEIVILRYRDEKKAMINNVLYNIKEIKLNEVKNKIDLDNKTLSIILLKKPEDYKIEKIEIDGPHEVKERRDYFEIKALASEIRIKLKKLASGDKEVEKNEEIIAEENEIISKSKEKRKITKLIISSILIISTIALIITIISYAYYNLIYKKKKLEEEKKKFKEAYIYHKKKEEELEEMKKKELEMKKEELIEYEARKLITWVQFLLRTYDKKEIYEYLIKKGYKKEVVDKAFKIMEKEGII